MPPSLRSFQPLRDDTATNLAHIDHVHQLAGIGPWSGTRGFTERCPLRQRRLARFDNDRREWQREAEGAALTDAAFHGYLAALLLD